jgi:hypothetical protein
MTFYGFCVHLLAVAGTIGLLALLSKLVGQ